MSTLLSPNALVGTPALTRLALRRDRWMILAWLAVPIVVSFASAAATKDLYSTDADLVKAADTINSSPGIVALYGPILDPRSIGEVSMTKTTVTYAVLISVMMLFLVRRHLRRDEEDGEAELIASTAIGREAQLAAAVELGVVVSSVLGALTALVNILGGLPATGSIAFGAAWAGTGLVGVGVTALACQLSPSARTCAGVAGAAFAVVFVLRAVGDASDAHWLSWLSPYGWNTQLRAYSDTRWWVLLLYAALFAVLVLAARTIRLNRDLGAGVLAPRPGPAVGSPRLGDVFALSLKTHSPMLLAWTLSVAAGSLLFGAVSPSFDDLASDNVQDMLSKIGGMGAMRDILVGAVAAVMGLLVTCFAVAVVGHGGADEHDGRTEEVLATATSRARLFVSTTTVALAGATLLTFVAGLGLAIGTGTSSDHSFGEILLAGLGQAPAVWVTVAIAALLFAISARWAPLGWVALVVFATFGYVGELLRLPDGVLRLSPYTHIPKMPIEPWAWAPELQLTGVAALVLLAGWWCYRGRDIG